MPVAFSPHFPPPGSLTGVNRGRKGTGAMCGKFVYLSPGAYVTQYTYDCREGVMELLFAPALRAAKTGILAT